jgi:hypothetical protein
MDEIGGIESKRWENRKIGVVLGGLFQGWIGQPADNDLVGLSLEQITPIG